MIRLPRYVLFLAFVFCLPTILGACTTAPQMPPAVPEALVASFAAPHTNGKLYNEPCTDAKVLQALPPELRPRSHAATGTYQGEVFGVCWLWNDDESAAVVIWDDGGFFAVPRSLLKFPQAV